jgi:hypothetical protein
MARCGTFEVSVPYVAALIADSGKYYMERKRIDDDTEKRRARAPSFTYLVRLARRCQSAEELGKRLRRRYQRQQQRQGAGRPNRSRAEGALAEELDRLLVHD